MQHKNLIMKIWAIASCIYGLLSIVLGIMTMYSKTAIVESNMFSTMDIHSGTVVFWDEKMIFALGIALICFGAFCVANGIIGLVAKNFALILVFAILYTVLFLYAGITTIMTGDTLIGIILLALGIPYPIGIWLSKKKAA